MNILQDNNNEKEEDLINIALKKYENEELFEFLNIINNNKIIKEKILEQKDENFKKLLMFEEDMIDFFIKEINDTEGYKKISGSKLDISTKWINKVVTLKFIKEVELDIISFISMIYEIDYYKHWNSFVTISETLKQPGKAKKCGYFVVNLPIIYCRDFLIYGFGINRIKENGTILLLCRGIDEECGLFKEQFKNTINKKYVRGNLLMFGAEIKILGEKKVLLRGLVNADLKLLFPIPEFTINLTIKFFSEKLFNNFIKIVNNYKGSKYENKNKSKIHIEFYEFLIKEINENLENKNVKELMKKDESIFNNKK
jgi:hypothetical protein